MTLQRKLQASLTVRAYGANPTNRYPLGRCRGDCDTDDHCQDGLICYHRERYQDVPGCAGGGDDRTPSDYCIDPRDDPGWAGPRLAYLGRNPPTMGRDPPLQECEGDCDQDSDCARGLFCLQRTQTDGIDNISNGRVPGCRGFDTTSTDYCVRTSWFPNNSSNPGPSSSSSVSPPAPPPLTSPSSLWSSSSSSSSYSDATLAPILDFALKLYWQQDYRWQEEAFDRMWCMECRSGGGAEGTSRPCGYGDRTYVDHCGPSNGRYDFIFVNGGEEPDVVIRLHGTALCLEQVSLEIFLYGCDSSNVRQLWFAPRGDLLGGRFEISPRNLPSHCVTQPHHPKAGEEVGLATCSGARDSQTSYWNRY